MPRLRLLWGIALLLGACAAPKEPPSWRLFPLERHSPHDGVAVVNQPDGYGLHIYLETDTSFPGCVVLDGCRIQPACSTAMDPHRSVPGWRPVRSFLMPWPGAMCVAC